jgi:hypothetical protein
LRPQRNTCDQEHKDACGSDHLIFLAYRICVKS